MGHARVAHHTNYRVFMSMCPREHTRQVHYKLWVSYKKISVHACRAPYRLKERTHNMLKLQTRCVRSRGSHVDNQKRFCTWCTFCHESRENVGHTIAQKNIPHYSLPSREHMQDNMHEKRSLRTASSDNHVSRILSAARLHSRPPTQDQCTCSRGGAILGITLCVEQGS